MRRANILNHLQVVHSKPKQHRSIQRFALNSFTSLTLTNSSKKCLYLGSQLRSIELELLEVIIRGYRFRFRQCETVSAFENGFDLLLELILLDGDAACWF